MLRFAMLGAGRIAGAHARSFTANPDAELRWVADPVPGAAERIAGPAGARATLDARQAIEADDVDAVLVCSPTPTHVDMILAAVEAGKAVLCEKPIDLSMSRVDELLTALDGREARVMMGFNRRFDPSFADIHARVTAGEVGSVEQVVIVSRDPAAPPREYVASSGGIFRDMTIHDFDMVRFFLPEIVEVSASGQNVIEPFIAEAGDFDGAVTTLRAANGAVATIINSRRCTFGYDQRLEVFGSLGMLQAANVLPNSVRSFGTDHAEKTAPYPNFFLERYVDAYAGELAAFIEAVRTGGPLSPSLEDGRQALVLAEAAEKAARSGRTVTLPAPTTVK
ncbi:myo-inositol 2-dehydrogenase [Raineyella antarctica]|uniref:Myo-inositol 2-dehydrogenase n=1 Tax=Raineyella antarctica TaxID=1577474 RepID=A0A1G6GEX9_9ACTN|nr:inositol 2-dehydrogenase [Raineyella antarctica]SDB80558.1 myo-inositol 2-dehydrogenase [Raineyella antarctica]